MGLKGSLFTFYLKGATNGFLPCPLDPAPILRLYPLLLTDRAEIVYVFLSCQSMCSEGHAEGFVCGFVFNT